MGWSKSFAPEQNAVDCRYAAPVKVDIEFGTGDPNHPVLAKVVKKRNFITSNCRCL